MVAATVEANAESKAESGVDESTLGMYEGMFLLDSGPFSSDPDGTTQHVLDVLEKVGAEVVAHRPWLDGRLAYPINKQRKGLHYLTYFKMETSQGLEEIDRSVRLSDVIMRHLVIRHEAAIFDASVAALGSDGDSDDDGEKGADDGDKGADDGDKGANDEEE